MPSHVHLIISEVSPVLHQVLGNLKKYSSRLANQYLGLEGKPFWHRESYDHIIRDNNEFRRQIEYVLNNPVKAGLVKHWEDWVFTYLREEYEG